MSEEREEWLRFVREHYEHEEAEKTPKPKANGKDHHPPPSWTTPEPESLTLASWLSRDLPAPDFIFGEVISTTSRIMLVGPTGLGKTHIGIAVAVAIAAGQDYLHWTVPAPRRVLYIDGEMSRRLLLSRLEDAVRRATCPLDAPLFVVSREDCPDMPPLNTEAGQQFIDAIITALGRVDVIFFDNIQCLVAGDMKDEEGWAGLLPWVRDLTRRQIGQVWIHHTGHDETRAYGTKTREWQLDTVALMERIERPELDIAFKLTFPKARERTPDNRTDFDPAIITLADDQWSSERGGHVRTMSAKRNSTDHALALLNEAITTAGEIPPESIHIPPNTRCVREDIWRRYCDKSLVSLGSDDPVKQGEAKRKAFERAEIKLVGNKVGKWDPWVWIIK
jgi:hypothetical protein